MAHEKKIVKDGIRQLELVSAKKADIRNAIEQNVTFNYDIYDIVADMANALNDLIDGKTQSVSIDKYKARQNEIKQIISSI